jgi:preprotein translocase subunit YajC
MNQAGLLSLLLCLSACSIDYEAPYAGVKKGAKVIIETTERGGTLGYVTAVTKEGVQIERYEETRVPLEKKNYGLLSEEAINAKLAEMKGKNIKVETIVRFFPWTSVKSVRILSPAP